MKRFQIVSKNAFIQHRKSPVFRPFRHPPEARKIDFISKLLYHI